VEVTFSPQSEDSFVATLEIDSNDSSNPKSNIQLSGSAEPIASLNVGINQVESDLQCPAAKVTAYVSVTDQGGYPFTGLTEDDFTVSEDAAAKNIEDLSFVSEVTTTISVALAMDYSGSIIDRPEYISDMQDAVADFVDQLGANDEAEIIKFGTDVEVVQNFTSDKNLLKDAINEEVDLGRATSLYRAAVQAVDDTALRLKERKAVVIVTDGKNLDSPFSDSLTDVINDAVENGIPIFTVGQGDDIAEDVLTQMADDTGGQFFNSTTSDNLLNIYNQLSDILFEDQYIIRYMSAIGVGATGDLTIQAESDAIMGDDIKEITPCP
jgi:Ca-activated chloride channel family protein